MTNNLRRRVWPKLLGINRYAIPDYRSYIDPHKDELQVKCDVERSLYNYDVTKKWDDELREKRRTSLSNIIMAILSRHPQLHYFQGFHDIVAVFLLIAEEDHLAFALTEQVCLIYMLDCMLPDFEIVSKSMQTIMLIIKTVDKKLHKFLSQASIEPFFATSWLITWFAHDIKELNRIARVYDAMICSHPLLMTYISTALVLNNREEILKCDCDFATLHNFLVHLPDKFDIPFDKLLILADELMVKVPPDAIKNIATNDLRNLLKQNKVSNFNYRRKNIKYTDSDWRLLQKCALMKSVSSQNIQKWGWELNFGDDNNNNNNNDNNNNSGSIRNLIGRLSPMKPSKKMNNKIEDTINTPEVTKQLFSDDYTYFYVAGGVVLVALVVNITLHIKNNNNY